MLLIETVSHAYGALQALQSVSLDVAAGEVVCLLGPSGCGKSTLLRIAAGLEPVQQGRVILGGQVVGEPRQSLPPELRRVGMVFQDFALFPHLTVAQNIAFGLSDLSRPERQAQAALWVERIGLPDLADSFPHTLSGGQQQRVALARALAPSPRLVLMDEPFSGLDVTLRDRLRDATLALLKEAGVATVLVTHDPDEAMRMADRIVLMRAGRIEQVGRPLALYDHPVSAFTAAFFGSVTVLEVRAEGGQVATDLGRFDAPVLSGPVTMIVRQEALHRVPEGGLIGVVTQARSLGREHLVGLTIGSTALTARWAEGRLPKVGDRLPLVLDRHRVHLFAKEA
ncbi:ABC transporter ATP-binding protein [Elstera sp.]|jgi:iron(III) transport system ATP-binding protein|uniref:ABC transporter ATP-binding protein n=1 Tax=Elstera sp. TaxID=1916664 RepID=UPI0037BFB162